jgi:hypothetical protein
MANGGAPASTTAIRGHAVIRRRDPNSGEGPPNACGATRCGGEGIPDSEKRAVQPRRTVSRTPGSSTTWRIGRPLVDTGSAARRLNASRIHPRRLLAVRRASPGGKAIASVSAIPGRDHATLARSVGQTSRRDSSTYGRTPAIREVRGALRAQRAKRSGRMVFCDESSIRLTPADLRAGV